MTTCGRGGARGKLSSVTSPSSFLALGLAVLACACGDKDGERPPSSAASSVQTASAGDVLPAADEGPRPAASSSAKAAADPVVAIEAGKLTLGSTPGDRGRDPTLEPPGVVVEVGGFDIDRFLYPNDLGKPPKTGLSRAQAKAACAERGRRLCTETEWERACKGPSGADLYPGGSGYREVCSSDPKSCASGFGVLGMGSIREWTASDVTAIGDAKGGAAVRGGPRAGADVEHRCAKRSPVEEGRSDDDLGFRCCGGEPSTVPFPLPKEAAPFEPATLGAGELARIIRAVPQLASLSGDPKFFDEAAAVRELESRVDGGKIDGYKLTTAPLAWRPALGEELVVVAVQVGVDSLVAAFHRLPDDRLRVASTLVLRKDAGPVVLAYDRSAPRRLEWSTCWGCRGESGRVTYRDDRRVVITQE